MTTTRSYSCNLCHGVVNEGTGIGLVWGTSREGIKLTVPANAETHVCQDCLNKLEAALADQREHQRIRATADT